MQFSQQYFQVTMQCEASRGKERSDPGDLGVIHSRVVELLFQAELLGSSLLQVNA